MKVTEAGCTPGKVTPEPGLLTKLPSRHPVRVIYPGSSCFSPIRYGHPQDFRGHVKPYGKHGATHLTTII